MSTWIEVDVEGPNTLYRSQRKFNVLDRYSDLNYLDAGAYGTVVKAFDKEKKKLVAIKKLYGVFENDCTSKMAYRELILLKSTKHPNVVRLLTAFTPQESPSLLREIYLVMELVDMTLHQLLYTPGFYFGHMQISVVLYQLLEAVKYLHSLKITHRDLKPKNIAIQNAGWKLKVLDMGMARIVSDAEQTQYVVTRYYRAPEILLHLDYTVKVDIWSIGCIIAELANGQILFQKENSLTMWSSIQELLGPPGPHFYDLLSDKANQMKCNGMLTVSKEAIVKCLNGYFIKDTDQLNKSSQPDKNMTINALRDLCTRMLTIDPTLRPSVEECLQHEYVEYVKRNWTWEQCDQFAETPHRAFNSLENENLTLIQWKHRLFKEIKSLQETRPVRRLKQLK